MSKYLIIKRAKKTGTLPWALMTKKDGIIGHVFTKEDAVLLLKAYNNHERLVAACQLALRYCWRQTHRNPEKTLELALKKSGRTEARDA